MSTIAYLQDRVTEKNYYEISSKLSLNLSTATFLPYVPWSGPSQQDLTKDVEKYIKSEWVIELPPLNSSHRKSFVWAKSNLIFQECSFIIFNRQKKRWSSKIRSTTLNLHRWKLIIQNMVINNIKKFGKSDEEANLATLTYGNNRNL